MEEDGSLNLFSFHTVPRELAALGNQLRAFSYHQGKTHVSHEDTQDSAAHLSGPDSLALGLEGQF